jgi:hypothetical protein
VDAYRCRPTSAIGLTTGIGDEDTSPMSVHGHTSIGGIAKGRYSPPTRSVDASTSITTPFQLALILPYVQWNSHSALYTDGHLPWYPFSKLFSTVANRLGMGPCHLFYFILRVIHPRKSFTKISFLTLPGPCLSLASVPQRGRDRRL